MQTDDAIFIDQNDYVKSLKYINITNERELQKEEVLTHDERRALRSVSGQLLWITSQTRPDAAFNSCYVSNCGKEPTAKNLVEANRAIKKIQSSDMR